MNGESTSMVWPTLGSRTAKEQNRIFFRHTTIIYRPNDGETICSANFGHLRLPAWGFVLVFYSYYSPKMRSFELAAWDKQTEGRTDRSIA